MSKKNNKKIQDDDRSYNLLHRYVGFVVHSSYSEILQVGEENIPKDGAIIFAINHANTLMDAMVILTADHKPKVFVARADIFKNRKLAKIFTFLKIMPIMRQRDGIQAVKKNQETIDKAVDVLKDKIPFCIFPEGTHQAKYSLRSLSKGIFRIAFQAHEQMPEVPLYIVPVGLKYGDFFRFRSTVRLQYGQPINVGDFIAKNEHLTPQEQMNSMKELLTERLCSTIFYIPNDEDYQSTYEICKAVEPMEVEELRKNKANKKNHPLEVQHQANIHALKRIEAIKEHEPEKAGKLLELGEKAGRLREKKGIDIGSVSVKKPLVSRMARVLLTLITLPYTLPVSLLACPVVLLCQFIFTKLKDPAFRNSVRFVMNLLVWPLWVLIYAIIACCLLPWLYALLAILLIIPAPLIAHELWKTVRLSVSDIKLLKEKKLRRIYSRIKEMMIG